MNNSGKATSSQLTVLGSVPSPLIEPQPLTSAELAADSEMLWRHILIMQFRLCHKGMMFFGQGRVSLSVGLKSLPIVMWTYLGSLQRNYSLDLCSLFSVRQEEPWMALPESVGLRRAKVHQCL